MRTFDASGSTGSIPPEERSVPIYREYGCSIGSGWIVSESDVDGNRG
jgi:hypothetical protein